MKTSEETRLEVQRRVDAQRSQEQRNRLGQFATESALAQEMLSYAKALFPEDGTVRFLDPAFGTGAFYSALLHAFPLTLIEQAKGFEIDPGYGLPAQEIWKDTPVNVEIGDFTQVPAPQADRDKYNLIICNPPYVRHHHLSKEDKTRLGRLARARAGVRLSGLAGLYCYFLCLAQPWMAPDAVAGWLIPSEFMGVNYGTSVKNYLTTRVTLLRVHRFDPADVQFKDAYVSSAIVWFRNARPTQDASVEFTFGGSLDRPTLTQRVRVQDLQAASKWTNYPETPENHLTQAHYRLSDFFDVRRGLATGSNEFFIMTEEQAKKHGLPSEFLRPVLPPPRGLGSDLVEADEIGHPALVPKLVLLDCPLSEKIVQDRYPPLWRYLQTGLDAGVNERYLCRHRRPWYSQESRRASPILCSYLGRRGTKRGKPFRFVLNLSNATATNVWLMLFPKRGVERKLEGNRRLLEEVWRGLNGIPVQDLLGHGRVYGGGLYKLEPTELGSAPADFLAQILLSS